MKVNDCYQAHAFIVKRNSYFFNQRRFIVLTNHFMINAEADFNEDCSEVTFAKKDGLKWKVPLAALKAMQMQDSGDYFKLIVYFDLPEVNRIM